MHSILKYTKKSNFSMPTLHVTRFSNLSARIGTQSRNPPKGQKNGLFLPIVPIGAGEIYQGVISNDDGLMGSRAFKQIWGSDRAAHRITLELGRETPGLKICDIADEFWSNRSR